MKRSATIYSIIILACVFLMVSVATAQDASQRIKQAIQGHTFSHRIDDTRTNYGPAPLRIKIGIVGVEYLLDGARLNVVSVRVSEVGSDPLGLQKKYDISVRSKIEGARYKEKHFRGVGYEYHMKNEHNPSAELEFIYRLDIQGLRQLDVRQVSVSAKGRALEQLKNGGAGKVLERIRTVL
jgi:hypothetical protein